MTFQIRQYVLHSGFYADRCGSCHIVHYRFLYVIILSGSLTPVTEPLAETPLVGHDIARFPRTIVSDVVPHDVIGAMLRSDACYGTAVVNGTIEPILEMVEAKAVFYGIHIAGVARLPGLERFCPRFRREACISVESSIL